MSAPGLDDPGVRDELGRVVLDALPADVVAASRAAWVAALRSGDYVQGRGELRVAVGDGSRWCCLGVAEDVARGGRGWTHVTSDVTAFDATADDYDEPGWGVPDERLRVRLPSPVTVNGESRVALRLGTSDGRETKVLSSRTCRWLGVWESNPAVVRRSEAGRWEVTTLVSLNDSDELSLAEIADVLVDQPADWDGTAAFALEEVRRRRAYDGDVDPPAVPS